MFDLSITKILILGLLGLVIFGPDQLPRLAAQAGRALRDLRRLADNAKADLSEHLGPEFRDFDLNDLRQSVGLAAEWLSPMGVFRFSYGIPLNDESDDQVEEFQFSVGSAF